MSVSSRDYPSLRFVCDDIHRIANSLSELLRSSNLTRADRISLSVNIQKLRSHTATIYGHMYCDCFDKLFGISNLPLDKDEDLPF